MFKTRKKPKKAPAGPPVEGGSSSGGRVNATPNYLQRLDSLAKNGRQASLMMLDPKTARDQFVQGLDSFNGTIAGQEKQRKQAWEAQNALRLQRQVEQQRVAGINAPGRAHPLRYSPTGGMTTNGTDYMLRRIARDNAVDAYDRDTPRLRGLLDL